VCFILRYSSNWNPHRLHDESFPPKEKHNLGPSPPHLYQFCTGSNIWRKEVGNVLDHYMFSIVIQRVGTKLPEIFDLRYEYLFRRQFSRVSEANK
jgi:hypothetical protein